MKVCKYSSLFQIFNLRLFTSVWFPVLFSGLQYIIIFYFEAQFVKDLASGTQVGLCPFDMPHHSLSMSLFPGTTRGSRLILYFSSLKSAILPKRKNEENGIEKPRSGLDVLIVLFCHYSQTLSVYRVYMYLHTYINIDASIISLLPEGSF